jgi:tetratricopeptide (TPR) repeat protein
VDPEARRHYAEALWQRGSQTKALEQFEEAARLSPDDAALRVRLAEAYLESGRLDEARAAANAAIDLDPKLAGAWAVRGRISAAAGDLRRALDDFHRTLSYAPDDRDVLLETAELHRRMGRPQRALATLQSLADTYSPGEEPQQVLQLTGLAQMALGRYDDAVAALSAAAVREAPSADLLWQLGEAELRAGRPGAAAAAARHALSLHPEHEPSRVLLARIGGRRAGETPLRR